MSKSTVVQADDGSGILWPVSNAQLSGLQRQLRSSRPEVLYQIPLAPTAPPITKEPAAVPSPVIKQEKKKIKTSFEDENDDVFTPSATPISAEGQDKTEQVESLEQENISAGPPEFLQVVQPLQINFDNNNSPNNAEVEEEELKEEDDGEDALQDIQIINVNANVEENPVEEEPNMAAEDRCLLRTPFRGVSEENAAEFWRRLKNYAEFKGQTA